MIDPTKNSDDSFSDSDRDTLINRIDELEKLLAQKKKESRRAKLPRLKVGTDGIPVLEKTIAEGDLNNNDQLIDSDTLNSINKDDQIINDIIDRIDTEVTEDLDELIVLLKDSIIDEVKTRLLNRLQPDKENK